MLPQQKNKTSSKVDFVGYYLWCNKQSSTEGSGNRYFLMLPVQIYLVKYKRNWNLYHFYCLYAHSGSGSRFRQPEGCIRRHSIIHSFGLVIQAGAVSSLLLS